MGVGARRTRRLSYGKIGSRNTVTPFLSTGGGQLGSKKQEGLFWAFYPILARICISAAHGVSIGYYTLAPLSLLHW